MQQVCLPDGGGDKAVDLFPAAGFPLTPVTGSPGYFVCRVKGSPADADCSRIPPAEAYWALWWADSDDGRWTYSSRGVGSLVVPDGGWLGFVYDDVPGAAEPGVTPRRAAAPSATPTPTSSPQPGQPGTAGPTRSPGPSGGPSTPSATDEPSSTASPGGSSTDEPTEDATGASTDGPTDAPTGRPTDGPTDGAKGGRTEKRGRTASPTAEPTDGATPPPTEVLEPLDASDPPDASADGRSPDPGGLPGWAAPFVLVVLAAAAGGAWWWRRRALPS